MPFWIQLSIHLHAQQFSDVRPLNFFFIIYRNFYIIDNSMAWNEYHIMGIL